MDVLCEHCGKEIPGDSKFCRYCGQPVIPQSERAAQTDIEAPHASDNIAISQSDDQTSASSKKPLFITAVIVAAICAAFFFHVNKNQPVNQATAITVSNSEYKNRMNALFPQLEYHSKQMVLEALDHPERPLFIYDQDAFVNDGVLLTSCGTVTYKDAQDQEHSQGFEATLVMNGEVLYYLMLKLDGEALYNKAYAINSDGVITATDQRFSGRGYGEIILDDVINPDKWTKNASDYNNAEEEITLAEFTAITLGMDYKEICAIIGSGGVETSRVALLGSETAIYMWEGIGAKDAGAVLTFVDDVLIAKEQEGLK